MHNQQANKQVYEKERLSVLEEYQIFGTAPERVYDDLTRIAAYICGTPVSLVSFVGRDTQFFKSAHGSTLSETARELSFCAHTLQTAKTLVVEDAQLDDRFAGNALVQGDPHIRFYAGAPILAKDGHVVGTVCVIDDKPRALRVEQIEVLESLARQVTELLELRRLNQRQEEAADNLKKTALQLRLAIEAGKLGIFSWLVEQDVTIWENDRMYEVFGRNREQGPLAATQFFDEVVHPKDRQSFIDAATSVKREGDRLQWSGRYLHGNGSVRWVEFLGLAERTPDGELLLVGTTNDITERKLLEVASIEDRERLQIALEVNKAFTFDWTPDNDAVRWGGVPPFGRSADELPTSADVLRVVYPEDAPKLTDAISRVKSHGDGYVSEFRVFWPDGSLHWIRTTGRLIDLDPSVERRIVGVNLDITDRKLAEEALLHTERLAAVGRLASTISHEINNPLEAVTNLLFIVRNSAALTQDDKDHLDLADRELARVGQITAQTLRFHRNLQGAGDLKIMELIEELLTLYRSRLRDSGIDVELRFAEGTHFTAFEGDIRQVLNNLVANAFDAMRKGGKLYVRAHPATDWRFMQKGVTITLADTGAGMPPGVQLNAFEAFYSTKGINGTGLGLWISKRIVHKHKGHLRFRTSMGPSHGTVFRLWLPLDVAQSAGEAWA